MFNCASNCDIKTKETAEKITAKKDKRNKPKKGKTKIDTNEIIPTVAETFKAKLFFAIEIKSCFFMCLCLFDKSKVITVNINAIGKTINF